MLIEDYALVGDTHSAALISKAGSVDWLCLPRFDSGACFAKLLGDDNNGKFQIAPAKDGYNVSRRYIPDTLVLETIFENDKFKARLIDFMPIRDRHPRLIRTLEGLEGECEFNLELIIRFDYGSLIPWVRNVNQMLTAVAGPDALSLFTTVKLEGKNMTTVSNFKVTKGDRFPFILTYHSSIEEPPVPPDTYYSLNKTIRYWQDWISTCTYQGNYQNFVKRSLLTLKALTYEPTGGIIAAPTTSLPETLGGERNWDYRYCWLRDATLTLTALTCFGFHEEALSWRDWLVRTSAGDVSRLQMLYGVAGERRITEYNIDWLKGYENSRPVRIGNAASEQFQLDVYGEVMSAFHEARNLGFLDTRASWDLQLKLVDFVMKTWKDPDDGIWEVRGGRKHFTHSKMMAWVALDRAAKAITEFNLSGDLKAIIATRDAIKQDVLKNGFNKEIGAFTQYYGASELDASILMAPMVGFIQATDPRMRSTIEKIATELVEDRLVLRYKIDGTKGVDGLSGKEGAFLACSFWLVNSLELIGEQEKARELFEYLLSLSNDLGLLAEEYDTTAKRQVGNFPQGFSHISVVNSADYLSVENEKNQRKEFNDQNRQRILHKFLLRSRNIDHSLLH